MIFYYTLKHSRPLIGRYTIRNIFWAWSALRLKNKRGLGFLIFCKKDLALLVELAGGGKEEGENWRQRDRNPSVPVSLFIHILYY